MTEGHFIAQSLSLSHLHLLDLNKVERDIKQQIIVMIKYCFTGSYCVASTDLIPVTQGAPCPAGTYGAREGLEQESDCTTCDAGYYCETEGNNLLTVKVPLIRSTLPQHMHLWRYKKNILWIIPLELCIPLSLFASALAISSTAN